MNHEGMEGSVIVITGGGSGMGAAMAKDLRKEVPVSQSLIWMKQEDRLLRTVSRTQMEKRFIKKLMLQTSRRF